MTARPRFTTWQCLRCITCPCRQLDWRCLACTTCPCQRPDGSRP